MRDLVFVDHLVFLHLLDSDDLTSLFVAADAHLTKGASADDLQRLKVLDCDPRSPIPHDNNEVKFLIDEEDYSVREHC